MTDPVIAQKNAMFTPVEEGKSYHWCACGLSKNQPFCDGSHKDTGLAPVSFELTEKTQVINALQERYKKLKVRQDNDFTYLGVDYKMTNDCCILSQERYIH